MEIVSITIDSKSKRYYEFLKNHHLEVKNFNAIIGKNLSEEKILSENLATNDLLHEKRFFSYGAIGYVVFHKAIREKSINENKKFLSNIK